MTAALRVSQNSAKTPALRLAGDRATALAVIAHARDADDARLLLEALGLVEPVRQARVVPAHDRCGRSTYVPGCPGCRRINARYMARLRRSGRTRRRVVTSHARLVEVATRTGRGRRAAYPGQLALVLEDIA